VRDVQGDTIVLTFRHTVHAGMLANSPQSLIDAISEVLGGQWQIRTEVAGPMQPTLLADSPASGSAAPAGAHPDGAGAPRPATGVDTSMPAGDDADWPTLARPGGAPVAAAATAGPGEGSAEPPAGQPTRGVANQAAAGTAVPAGRPASRQRAGTIPASAARGADRSGPAATPGRGAARSGQPPSGGGRGQRRPTTTSTTPAYDGFDPDDGPGETEVAGVADRPVVQTTEQRALQLLQQALGAEKISESGG
jgi:DNA polymerase-3 subunit gamma/tau